MLPGIELMGCADLAVPASVMQHVVRVESSFNPYAIGVVGGRLVRQPRSLPEAVSTAKMLQQKGYNFSIGLAQVNKTNFAPQGLKTLEEGFDRCKNLRAGSRILAECYGRSGNDWGKAFSCYYSGNFTTGYRHGYVQKVFESWGQQAAVNTARPIPLAGSSKVNQAKPVARAVAAKTVRIPDFAAKRIEAIQDLPPANAGPADRAGLESTTALAAPPAVVRENSDLPVTVSAYGAQPGLSQQPATSKAEQSKIDDAFVF